MNKPNFIIIGAAKSGTTTLYEYLCQYEQIYMSTPKEPDFFSLDMNYNKGIEWYDGLFKDAQPGQVCGEASTTYSRCHQHPKTVERIAKHLPEVKLIYIMRHPVDRAYSFYVHRYKGSKANRDFLASRNELMTCLTFEEAIVEQSEFLESSLYIEQIEKYLKYFPKESFLFLLMEDLIADPTKTINEILRFIGADIKVHISPEEAIVANQAGNYPEWYFQKQLVNAINRIPGNQSWRNLLPKNFKNKIYDTIKLLSYNRWQNQQYIPPPMLPETRQRLIQEFKYPNQKLADFLNRDLTHWNQ